MTADQKQAIAASRLLLKKAIYQLDDIGRLRPTDVGPHLVEASACAKAALRFLAPPKPKAPRKAKPTPKKAIAKGKK